VRARRGRDAQTLEIAELNVAEAEALDTMYRTTRVVRLRTRAQIVLLAGEQRLTAQVIARIVREDEETGLRLSYETVHLALKAGGIVLSRPQHTVTSPDPEYRV
jgi:hypothetical protein